jgi:hypothetical protein
MKKYRIPVSWQMYGYVTVEAKDLDSAYALAETDMGIGLPDNGSYVEGSWEADHEVRDEVSEIDFRK